MKYREELQNMILALDQLYDRAGSLRDSSGIGKNEGKDEMNEIRKQISILLSRAKNLDYNLPEWLANSEL